MWYTTELVLFATSLALVSGDYWKDRDDLIKLEESRILGASIVLTEKEEKANTILMGYKLEEYDAGFKDPGIFAPGKHFFQAREAIENSRVFQFIQKMPKGAALHGHEASLTSFEYLYSLTYRDNLYACTVDKRLKLRFFLSPKQDQTCDWTLISTLRQQDPSYDDWVRSQLTMDVKEPRQEYPNTNAAWKAMEDIFDTVSSFVTYKPVFQDYFHQALLELYQDNVMYLEFRGELSTVYDLDGTTYGPMEVTRLYREVVEEFKHDHPGFLGARLIYTPSRADDNANADKYMSTVKALKSEFPDFVAGFDLSGQEDKGKPLTSFIRMLQEIPRDIDFFFHSGETNWFGSTVDENLYDAILLGTKRIGHGFGLIKHPRLMEIVKERPIAIEVCPVSNQVLMLVEDMRNHPAAYLIAQGYPVVISNDVPSFWSTKGLSYDFYLAFVGIASRNSDLRLLKQLSKNSLLYSSLSEMEKDAAITAWNDHWETFIDGIIAESSTPYNKSSIEVIH